METTNLNQTIKNLSFINLSADYCIKGTQMADEGNLKEALENYSKAIESNPDNHIAYYNRATIKFDLGDIEGAKNDFQKFDSIRLNSDRESIQAIWF